MKIQIKTRYKGRPGASFAIQIGETTIPRLSVYGLQQLILEANAALRAHSESRREARRVSLPAAPQPRKGAERKS